MMIRKEREADILAVRLVNERAFESKIEADIVDILRGRGAALLSLVAELDNETVGHILFSPVTIDSGFARTPAAGLGPMAVLPEHQRLGIGSALVRAGLEACARDGHEAIFVLGHPDYYPRFGFVPAVRYSIQSEFGVPDEVFMAKELKKGALKNVTGTVRYHEAFQDA